MRKTKPLILSILIPILLSIFIYSAVQANQTNQQTNKLTNQTTPDFYVNQANNSDLVAHWSMDDAGGTDHLFDISGNNHHAVKHAPLGGINIIPTGQPRVNYRSYDLRPGNYYADADAFDINDDFTIASWVYVNNTTASQSILSKHTSGGSNQLVFGIYASEYHLNIGGSHYDYFGTPTTGWQHLVVVGRKIAPNQTEVTFYRDGVQLEQHILGAEIGDVSGGRGWTIGQDWDGNNRTDYLNGMIDDLRIYNRDLSLAEIAHLANGYACLGDGTSWATAYEDLNCALLATTAGDTIWVAGGTYKHSTNSSTHFILDKALSLYGGFAGTETALDQRDITTNPTTLNGDLLGDDVGNSNKWENSNRILAMIGNDPIVVDGFTISGGHAGESGSGAGIYNAGTVTHTLANSIVEYNSTGNVAGGVENAGILQIISSTVQHNSAPYGGGGIYNTATLLVENSTIIENDVTWQDSSGAGIYNENGHLTITHSDILSNTSDNVGGGIGNYFGGTILLDHVTVANNHADYLGGGIYSYRGATIYINSSTFENNHANSNGGGIYMKTRMEMDSTTIVSNTSGGIAGIYLAPYASDTANIHNSTIALNTSSTDTSTPGIHFGPGTFTLSAATIAKNIDSNFSPTQISIGNGATVTIDHTIIGGENNFPCDIDGTLNDAGYNLAPSSCGLTAPTTINDISYISANLEDNSPEPPTLILPEFSLAIDNGDPNCTGTDQRGVTRPQGIMHNGQLVPTAGCDIGATEVRQSVLETQYSPYNRYKEWADSTLFNPTHQFRITEITKPSISATTTITDIHLSFADFTEGRLFWRYCADYDSITHSESCIAWDALDPISKTARVGTWQTLPLETPRDLHNKLAQANDIYRFVFNAPNPTHWIYDLLGCTPIECPQPYYDALALNVMAITDTLESMYEMAIIPAIYGNEFLVDGLHHNLGYVGQSGVEIINNEIALLEQAAQQFDIATQIWVNAVIFDMDGNGTYLGQYFNESHYETFAIASERQVTAVLEIAERRRLRGDDPTDILTMLAEAYTSQYLQSLALAEAFSNSPDTLDLYTSNGGRQLMNNLDRLNQMRDSLLYTSNPLGYDDKYVPRATFESLRDDMGEIGLCNNDGTVSGTNTGIMGDLFEKECAARFTQRDFDMNAANANSMTGELAQLKSTYEAELDQVCGSDRSGDTVCDGTGLLALNFDDLEAAHKRVALAWQRAQAIPQQILIEQQRSGQVIRLINGAALDINAHQLAIAKLEGYQEVRTVASTTEIWEEGSDPNDPESGAYWLDFGIDAGNCLLSGLTLGALGDGCQGNNENLGNNIAALAGIETKPSAIETVNKTWNPQAEEIAEIQGMKEMRAMELEADIVGANSQAVIRNLLLEQADLLIEYEIAIDELNRVITERNMFTQQYRNALNNRARMDVDYAQYVFNPAWRIIRDNSALQATQAHEKATHSVYLLIKAMEYMLLDEPVGVIPAGNLFNKNLYTALYQGRTAEHLEEIVAELDAIKLSISLSGSATYLRQISLAEDVLGLTDDNLSPLLPYTPDPAEPNWSSDPACHVVITTSEQLRTCLFRQYLTSRIANDPDLTGGNESVLFVFGTSIELINPENYLWNSRIAPVSTIGEDPCSVSDPCAGISVNILTDQTWTGGAPLIQLTHDGQATYRRQFGSGLFDTEITEYSPGPTAMVGQPIPAGFPTGNRVTRVVQSNVNGAGGQADSGFVNLSSAVTAWQFMMDIENGAGADVDLDKINDIMLEIDTIAYPIQNNLVAGRLAELRSQLLHDTQAGLVSNRALQSEYDNLLEEFNRQKVERTVSSFVSERTNTFYVGSSLFGGAYDGKVNIDAPVPLAIVDAGIFLTETDGILTGNLCISCTMHYGAPAEINGIYTDSGTLTDTFSLQSAPFTQLVNGQLVTRTVSMSGQVFTYGDIISGTYSELVTGYAITDTLVTGSFIMTRRPRGACAEGRPALANFLLALSGNDAVLSWMDDPANVGGYEVYRSSVPYFEVSGGSYLWGGNAGISTYTDTNANGNNHFYQVRAIGCSSSFIESSAKSGSFSFDIVAGN